ncbi:AI-2E family transporter [Candidatus Kaiserbacteria bacterium]|nr:AI-2E family transporter [Candidatus Kaiserbacteria bacterium]
MHAHIRHYFLLALLIAAGVLTFLVFQPFLAPLALGAVFAVVLHPIHQRFVKAFRGRESLAAFATVAISMIALLIPMFLIGFQLLKEANQLYGSVSAGDTEQVFGSLIQRAVTNVEQYVPNASTLLEGLRAGADQYARTGLNWMIQHLDNALSGIAALALSLFIFFVTLYYLLRDGVRLKDYLVTLSPLADQDDRTIATRLELAVNSVVKGKLAISATQGLLTGIGLALFGVPNPVLWGLIAAIASLIPPFGTALVIAPAVLFLFLTDHVGAAIGLTIWGTVAVGLIDNVLGPILMSSGMRLHPLLVLLSVLGGLPFFGPIGIFLGPLTLSLLLALLSVYRYLMENAQNRVQ